MLGLLLGRKGADSSEVAAEFREAIRLRPDFAEAHNNLGLVLIQAGDDQAGIAALARGRTPQPGLRGCARQPRRGAHAHRRRGSHPRAREGRGAGAGLGQGPVQPGGRLWRQPQPRTGERDRAAAQGHRARADVRAGPPGAWQGAAAGRQGGRRGQAAPGGGAAGADRAGKPTISSAWRWRARDARRKPRRSSRRAASSSPPTSATRTRTSTSPKAAPRSRKATSSERGRQSSVHRARSSDARHRSEGAKRYLATSAGEPSDGEAATSDDPDTGGGARRLHPRGQVHRKSSRSSPST